RRYSGRGSSPHDWLAIPTNTHAAEAAPSISALALRETPFIALLLFGHPLHYFLYALDASSAPPSAGVLACESIARRMSTGWRRFTVSQQIAAWLPEEC